MMPAHMAIKTKDPEELQALVDEYFESRIGIRKVYPRDRDPYEEEWTKPPTFAGLARSIGMSRMTLWRYLHRRDDLSSDLLLVLTRACERIAEAVEEATFNRETYQGARFALEVNHRYGREDDGAAAADGFHQTVIAPRADDEPLAIPKWSDDDGA